MSAQSIITKQNLPTGEVVGKLLSEIATDLLMELRYEVGHVCTDKMRRFMRMSRLHCNDYCYIDSEQKTMVREELIRQTITKLNEL